MAKQSSVIVGRCPNCKAEIPDDYSFSWCSVCSLELPPELLRGLKIPPAYKTPEAAVASSQKTQVESDQPAGGEGAIGLLQVIAWLNLVGGVVVGLAALGLEEVGPFRGFLCAAWISAGVVGCVFMLVVCSIAENVARIRRNSTILSRVSMGVRSA